MIYFYDTIFSFIYKTIRVNSSFIPKNTKMRNFLYILFLIILIMPGCKSSKKTLSDTELTEMAIEEGNRISMETQQLLGTTLKSKIQQHGIMEALSYCNLNAYPLVDSMQTRYEIRIKRASLDTRNPMDQPDRNEFAIIQNYQSDLEAGRTLEVFVEIRENEVHYARPILLNDAVCLNCHGMVGKDIAEENYRIIRDLYPEDQATGHSLGDLRGIWSLKFNKEVLEKRANTTKKQLF